MAVAAAGLGGFLSPGDYAAFKFPPPSRHDRIICSDLSVQTHWRRFIISFQCTRLRSGPTGGGLLFFADILKDYVMRCLLAVFSFLLLVGQSAYASEQSIVYIECTLDGGSTRFGSGVIISDSGHVLTAGHVAPENSECRGSIGRADPTSLQTLEHQPNQISAFDATILRFRGGSPFQSIRFCRFGPDMKRRPIFTVGFPGRSQTGAVSYRAGILSTTFLTPKGFLETDSMTAGGMSGGAVLTADEQSLVGIISGADFTGSTIGVPTSYAITPAQEVAQYTNLLVEDLKTCSERSPKISEMATLLEEARAKLEDIELSSGDFDAQAVSVVSISCTTVDGVGKELVSTGSGVIIDARGHVLTARHVLAVDASRCFARVGNSVSTDAYALTKRFVPDRSQLALMQLRPTDLGKVVGEDFRPVAFVRTQELENGIELATVGFQSNSRSGEAVMRIGVLTDNFPDDDGLIGAALSTTSGFGGAPAFLRNGAIVGIVIGLEFDNTGMVTRDTILSSERIADEFPNYVTLQ